MSPDVDADAHAQAEASALVEHIMHQQMLMHSHQLRYQQMLKHQLMHQHQLKYQLRHQYQLKHQLKYLLGSSSRGLHSGSIVEACASEAGPPALDPALA